ncbi:MAG: winged helix-turn-helix transcriptional regulator, partial [Clostridiales bacterium]|nr:winged helix-turn-helix transcriptional regulator [Candidatus Apopatousia equi]
DSKNVLISSKFKVLLEIDKKQKLSPSELVEKVGLAKSNIALLCKSMVKENLISMERDKLDSRIVLYSLTEHGKCELQDTVDKMACNFNRALEYKNGFKEIDELLTKLKDIID